MTSPDGRDELRADELIGGETPRAHHPADAAAEREPADADRGGVAGADAETVGRRGSRRRCPHVAPPPTRTSVPSTSTSFSAARSSVSPPGTVAPRAVPAAAHDDRDALGGRPAHGARDVCRRSRPARSHRVRRCRSGSGARPPSRRLPVRRRAREARKSVHRSASHRRYRRAPTRSRPPAAATASPALEDDVQRDARRDHQDERHRIAERPVQLGHVVEVHAVDRADQRRARTGSPPSPRPS